jgi:hypothetical protein
MVNAEWCSCQQPMYMHSGAGVCKHCDQPCERGKAGGCGNCARLASAT